MASLKANHICNIDFQVRGAILLDVGPKFAAIAAGLLADVRILVNVEDVQGSDLLDNRPQRRMAICAGNSAGHQGTGAYPLSSGFLDESSDFSGVVLESTPKFTYANGDTAHIPSARFGVVPRIYCAADRDIQISNGRWRIGRCWNRTWSGYWTTCGG